MFCTNRVDFKYCQLKDRLFSNNLQFYRVELEIYLLLNYNSIQKVLHFHLLSRDALIIARDMMVPKAT